MTQHKYKWLITGVSSGLGHALAEAALARGDTVLATFRRPEQAAQFEAGTPGRAFACVIDLADSNQVRAALPPVIDRAGGVEVVVNNAGYGLTGAVEEVSDEEARHQMEVNFFGALAVTQIAMPYLRHQRRGHIINITSLAGMTGQTGLALYCASKYALEGLGVALVHEARHFNIKVTNVEPGSFRTNWRGSNALKDAARVIEDYKDSVGVLRQQLAFGHGQQEGDPARAALAIIQVVESPHPPLHLPLNPKAWEWIRDTLKNDLAEMDAWSKVSHATIFPAN